MNLFPDRAVLLAKAARLAESAGLTVLDRDCRPGGYRVDLVAVTGEVLVVAEVRAVPHGEVRARAGDISAGRLCELLCAAAAWLRASGRGYSTLQVVSIVLEAPAPGREAAPSAGEER